jgi:hypothetical protein
MKNPITSPNAASFVAGGFLVALFLSGTAQAITETVFKYSTPQTGWLMIPAAAFVPVKTTNYSISNMGYITANTGQVCFLAPVNLPHKAQMTKLALWYSSINNNDVIIDLWRQRSDTTAAAQIVHLFPPPTSGLLRGDNDDITDMGTIDNQQFAYHVHLCLNNSALFTRARITYTYNNAGD